MGSKTQQNRAERIRQLYIAIKKLGSVDLDTLCSEASVQHGYSRKTTEDYLQALVGSKQISIEGKEIKVISNDR